MERTERGDHQVDQPVGADDALRQNVTSDPDEAAWLDSRRAWKPDESAPPSDPELAAGQRERSEHYYEEHTTPEPYPAASGDS